MNKQQFNKLMLEFRGHYFRNEKALIDYQTNYQVAEYYYPVYLDCKNKDEYIGEDIYLYFQAINNMRVLIPNANKKERWQFDDFVKYHLQLETEDGKILEQQRLNKLQQDPVYLINKFQEDYGIVFTDKMLDDLKNWAYYFCKQEYGD